METVTVDGQIFAYQTFLKNFVTNVNPEDPLPVRINNSNITRVEVTGVVIDWILQYLSSWKCPQTLMSIFARVIVDDIRPKLDPSVCPQYNQQQGEYSALPLMQYVIGVIRSVCLRYLETDMISSLPVSNSYHYYSVSASKNRRRSMEDSHVIINDLQKLFNLKDCGVINYYAVFDGHNGIGAALYSATHLHQYLAESQYYPLYPEQALCEAFKATDRHLLEKEDSQLIRSGTTAVCVLWHKTDQMLYVAWAGDSEALLARKGRAYRLVEPHRADREDEKKRIQEAGGVILFWGQTWRVNGQLAVSRAIGDLDHKGCIIPNPDVKSVPLDGDEDFVILACDGLWDSVKPEEAASVVYEHLSRSPDDYDQVSQILVQLAKSNRSEDNITVIVVYLTDPHSIKLSNADMETATAESFSTKQNGSSFCTLNNLQGAFDPEDDFGPETNIDNIDDGLLSQPASTKKSFTSFESLNNGLMQTAPNDSQSGSNGNLGDAVDTKNDLSDESDEDEWDYVKGAGADHKTNDHESSLCAENQGTSADALQEMDHKLNPDAAVFVPVSPTSVKSASVEDSDSSIVLNDEYAGSDVRGRLPPLPNDEFVASSPMKGQEKSMEDVDVPSLNDFDEEIRKRPSNILPLAGLNSDSESSVWNDDDDIYPIKKDELDLSPVHNTVNNDTGISTAAVFGDDSCVSKNMDDVNRVIAEANENAFSGTEQSGHDSQNKFDVSNGVFDNDDYPSIIEKDVPTAAFNFDVDKFNFEQPAAAAAAAAAVADVADLSFSDISGPHDDNPASGIMRDFEDFVADEVPTHSTVIVDGQPVFQANVVRTSPVDQLLSKADLNTFDSPFAADGEVAGKEVVVDDAERNEDEAERMQPVQNDEIDFLNGADVRSNELDKDTSKYSPFACTDEFVCVRASEFDVLANKPPCHELLETKSTPETEPEERTRDDDQALSAQILSDDEIVEAEHESPSAHAHVTSSTGKDGAKPEEPPCQQYDAETPYIHDCTRMGEKPDSVHHEPVQVKRYADLLPDFEPTSTMESDKLESELRGSENKNSGEGEAGADLIVEKTVLPASVAVAEPEIAQKPETMTTIADLPSAPELTETLAPAVDAVIAEARKEVKKSVIKKPTDEKAKAAPPKPTAKAMPAATSRARPAATALRATTEVKKASATSTTKTAATRLGLAAASRAPASKSSAVGKTQAPPKTSTTTTKTSVLGAAAKAAAPKLASPSKPRLASSVAAKTNGDASSTKPITARKIAPAMSAPLKKSPTEGAPAPSSAKPSVNLATRTSLAPRPKPPAPTSPEKVRLASKPTTVSRRPVSAPSKPAIPNDSKRVPIAKTSPLKTNTASKTESKVNSGLKKTATNSPTAVKKLSSTSTTVGAASQSSINSEHQN